MRVGIDLTALRPVETGVDGYLRNLVLHLGTMDRGVRYTLFVNVEDRRRLASALPRTMRIVPSSTRARAARLVFQQALLPALARGIGLDVVHSPSFIMPLVRGPQRHLLTVYDMTMFTMPERHIRLRGSRPFQSAVAASIRRADLTTVPSDTVRRDVVGLLPDVAPERVRVVAPGIDAAFRPDVEPVRRRRPYVLHVGTVEPRKNVEGLLDAFAELVRAGAIDEELVLAGRLGWGYRGVLARCRTPELRDRVHLVGYVPRATLPGLYAGARLFVFPSFAEGFGFPPLEAMACGVPTIASDCTSLAENLRGAAELVPPGDTAALATAMRELLCHEDRRRTLRARGIERASVFRWEDTARRTFDCYEALAARS